MGTRGAMIFVAGDREFIQYNQSDSYPDHLGRACAEFVEQVRNDPEMVRKIAALNAVNEQDDAPEELRARLVAYRRSRGSDWYQTLRKCQGNPAAVLECGYIAVTSRDWVADSLFCEWGYVMDFDERVLEVYRGFNRHKAVGRFSEVSTDRGGYAPITLVASIPFDAEDIVDRVLSTEA